jgi:hypothetical protein
MATRKRHSPEQIVRKLMAADQLLAGGQGHRGDVPRARYVGGDLSPEA